MTPQEQAAFVRAYARNVGTVPTDKVEAFVELYCSGVDHDYPSEYMSIFEALMMWNSAIKFNLEKQQ